MSGRKTTRAGWLVAALITGLSLSAQAAPPASASPAAAVAAPEPAKPSLVVGFRPRVGGRYDDVRMCVASPAGAKGGPSGDVSAFAEIPLGPRLGLDLDLPVMRPLLFAGAFEMLQFEPSASLRFRHASAGRIDPIFGPTLGVSLHYGPDYESEPSGAGRGPSFFALGPILGGYAGLDFKRPDQRFNFQLGLTAYAIPLFSVDDPDNHSGIVVGGSLDASFRFRLLEGRANL